MLMAAEICEGIQDNNARKLDQQPDDPLASYQTDTQT